MGTRPHILPIWLAVACGGEKNPCAMGYVEAPSGRCELASDSDTGSPSVPGDSPNPDPDSDPEDTAAPEDSGTTVPPDDLLTRTSCDAVFEPGPDPITDLGYTDTDPGTGGPPPILVELVDSSMEEGRFWGVGQGGILAFDVTGDAPEMEGIYPPGGGARYHHLHLVESSGETPPIAYVTNRDNGMEIIDRTNPSIPTRIWQWGASGLGGMAAGPDRLYVARQGGGITTLDTSEPTNPVELGTVPSDGHPWTLAIGDGVLYSADNTLGVGVFSLADHDGPTWLRDVDIGSGALDLAIDDGHLYVAGGTGGLVILDLADPAVPVEVGRLDRDAPFIDVAVGNGTAWLVDHESIWAVDVRDPTTPTVIGHRQTPRWAMTVAAYGDSAWVGDWSGVGGYQVTHDVAAPDFRFGPDSVRFVDGMTSASVTLHNEGSAAGTLAGWDASWPGSVLEIPVDEVPAHGSVEATLTWDSSGHGGTVCVVTDDPDEPVVALDVRTGGSSEERLIGEPAPDFVLSDLDGTTHRLSEQLGHPVVLVYFATW